MSNRLRHLRLALPFVAGLVGLHCTAESGPSASSNEEVSAAMSGPIHPLASSSLCLDVVGAGTANGTKVQVWACAGSANQQWTYDGTYLRVYGTKCLDMTNGSNADSNQLQIWDCATGNKNQMWTVTGSTLVWTGQNRCLDLTNGLAANGTILQSWTCFAGDENQEWTFPSTTNGGGGSSSGGGGGSSSGGNGTNGGGSSSGGVGTQPAPNFGPNVLIFDPSMSMTTIQSQLDSTYAQQDSAQFGNGRFAYFFKPGNYNLDVQIGFYTEVLGLGTTPDSATITGAVRAKADWLGSNNATCNFWRGAENLAVVPTSSYDSGTMVWATSQGTHLRRLHVKGNIILDDSGGWASGGFIADSLIDGQINSGSQQQYLTRNNDQNWTGSNWNMVFVGDGNAPASSWPYPSYTVQSTTPVVREKPYLTIDGSGNYSVVVPSLKTNSKGHSWASGAAPGPSLPIADFYVAHAGTDTAATLNAALSSGKHLLLTPGIYDLSAPLQVTEAGTVVLGLGLATLVATSGNELVTVADVDDVTVAGILLQAGTTSSPSLLQVGPSGSSADHTANPTALFDVHCRVGGAALGSAANCVTVNSNEVIIDNSWLWRADHSASGVPNGWTENVGANGITVNGANVTAYGLFVEHFQQYQTLWNGNGGSVYFYQSEMPYDPPNQAAWTAPNGEWGYPSYKVAAGVTSHQGEGIGVYSVFSNDVDAQNGIETPTTSGISMHHVMTVSLASGEIQHIINNTGGAVGNGTQTAYSSN